MSKDLIEIKGFKELSLRLEKFPDKLKKREVIKVLRRASRDTVKVARNIAPKDTGQGSKSIRFEPLKKSRNPGGVVGPRSKGKYDGFYMRLFVIPGHNIYKRGFRRNRRGNRIFNNRNAKSIVPENPFMAKVYSITKGRVLNNSVKGLQDYLDKRIRIL